MAQPKSKFLQLFERDQGRCVYCGLDLKADYDRFMMATEDHLLPGSKGGYARELENLVLSCRTCNSVKGGFVPDPGAGTGSLTAAVVEQLLTAKKKPRSIM